MSTRLSPQPLEWIDRSQTLRFRFEGREFTGYAGDSITSALWANGERVLGRSFKYHRPRGLVGLSDSDCNVMLESAHATNVRGDITLLRDGMELHGVNTWGGVRQDYNRFTELLGRFMPVGFYYKAFHRPRALFPYWEQFFRRMAGLGAVNPEAPGRYTPKRYDHCDVLVIGGGPSGLSAALAAADAGGSVLLVDERQALGGSLAYQWKAESARDTLGKLVERVRDHTGIRVRTGTTVGGAFGDRWMALFDDVNMTKLRARAVVVATGCYEQPAVFHNNDLPGVMMGSAVRRLIHCYAVRPFECGVVIAGNDEAYQVALDALDAGVAIAAVVDLRPKDHGAEAVDLVRGRGVEIVTGSAIYEAVAGPGKRGITGVRIGPFMERGGVDVSRLRLVACDGVAMSVGYAPADGLIRQSGGRMEYDTALEQFVPASLGEGYFACGRVNGRFTLDGRMGDGARAGAEAAAHCGLQVELPRRAERDVTPHSHPYPIVAHPAGKNFIDLDEDLQLKDFENAAAEGFDNAELMKRYTTVGMGPSQGKHSNLHAARILQRLGKHDLTRTGLTTARPFATPVPIKHLAGRRFYPVRRTPMHAWHEAHGATFLWAGNWRRPAYYTSSGGTRARAIAAEAMAVRTAVGLIDLGTLGKLEVIGPDALTFVERLYTGKFAGLNVGMTRYGIVCDEAGVVVDDGVVARLAEDHVYLSTTTTGAEQAYREFQRWLQIWKLDATIINASAAYTAMNIAGPHSAEVLMKLTDIDLGPEWFPYLAIREGLVAGAPARVMRVGFVGEWGYEIHVPASMGLHVWTSLMAAGEAFGVRPFGIEAQRLLRLEKGHVILGQDTDSMSHPFELGMDWAVKMDKPFFVGQRTLRVLRNLPRQRRTVGFTIDQGATPPQEGDLILGGTKLLGRVTSIAWSPSVKATIGLAIIDAAHAAAGTAFQITRSDGGTTPAVVASPHFYDPTNDRQEYKGTMPSDNGSAAVQAARSGFTASSQNLAPGEGSRVVQAMAICQGTGGRDAAPGLILCDTSAFQRFGVRLFRDPTDIKEFPVHIPSTLLSVETLEPAGFIARSGWRDLLLEDRTDDGALVKRFFDEQPARQPDYVAYRGEDASFVLAGEGAREVMTQVCSYAFDDASPKLIMTQLASVSGSVVHERSGSVPVFRIACGNPSAQYLWDALSAIVRENGGSIVELDDFQMMKDSARASR